MTTRDRNAAPIDAEASFRSLAARIERRPAIAVEAAPQTRSRRQVYWAIGLCGALLVAAAEVVILTRPDGAGAPPVPESVLQDVTRNACAARAMIIMQAVSDHITRTGTPPPALAALYPSELTVPPVDPVSGGPYVYEVQPSGAVTVSCPPSPS